MKQHDPIFPNTTMLDMTKQGAFHNESGIPNVGLWIVGVGVYVGVDVLSIMLMIVVTVDKGRLNKSEVTEE